MFLIDFFELCFLAEACIPPRPIARAMFWDKMIDEYYFQMTEEQRAKAFEWIQKNPSFDIKEEGCLLFYNRYNPENQHKVFAKHKGKVTSHNCFLHKGKYHIKSNTSILEKYIMKF